MHWIPAGMVSALVAGSHVLTRLHIRRVYREAQGAHKVGRYAMHMIGEINKVSSAVANVTKDIQDVGTNV